MYSSFDFCIHVIENVDIIMVICTLSSPFPEVSIFMYNETAAVGEFNLVQWNY